MPYWGKAWEEPRIVAALLYIVLVRRWSIKVAGMFQHRHFSASTQLSRGSCVVLKVLCVAIEGVEMGGQPLCSTTALKCAAAKHNALSQWLLFVRVMECHR
jgi:hypothetical protein